jgi:hypothetical protein
MSEEPLNVPADYIPQGPVGLLLLVFITLEPRVE